MSDRVSNTAERLKQLMRERNLKQIDVVDLCQPFCEKYGIAIRRNDISQYANETLGLMPAYFLEVESARSAYLSNSGLSEEETQQQFDLG